MDNEQMAAPLRNAETPESNLGKSLKQKAKSLKQKARTAKRKKTGKAASFKLYALSF